MGWLMVGDGFQTSGPHAGLVLLRHATVVAPVVGGAEVVAVAPEVVGVLDAGRVVVETPVDGDAAGVVVAPGPVVEVGGAEVEDVESPIAELMPPSGSSPSRWTAISSPG